MEGYGVLQFQGTFSELSWTVTAPEFYSGFTLGFTSNPMSTSAALPDPYSFAPGVLPPAFTASIRPINASNDVVSGLGTVTSRVFDGGTLILAANNADAFTITNLGGAMNVATGAVTASGVISNEGLNAGMLKKTGAGRLVLSAANTYSGGTTVEAGTLQISTMDNLGSGAVMLNGGTLAVTETISTNRTLSVGANNGTLDVASGKALTASGVVSGSGTLNKTSAGSLILSGTNTHTGALGVNQGTLVLNGSTASSVMTVSAGAVLTGSGSTAGRVVLAGSVKPGNSPGTLSVAGDFAMSAGSSFDAELDGRTYSAAGGAGSYDRIALTGASGVFTAAGTLTPVLRAISAPANNNFSPIVGDAFRVVTTANATGVSTSGAFSAVADPSAANGMPASM
jgi:autotransporter-associated beta strand protein